MSDKTRRADILRRTRMGLQDDIDDLRVELSDGLRSYEKRLRVRTDALPDWLELPGSRIRELFRFGRDSVEPAAMLGPRSVALGAGRLEDFVGRWFEADTIDRFDHPESADTLVDDFRQVAEYLAGLSAGARQVAQAAQTRLQAWQNAVLVELDDHREADIEAIEQLVREGEIERGPRARQEIADLWEEQRQQAAQLQQQWAPIVELVDRGRQASLDGADQLAAMLQRARQGLVGAQPDLDERLSAVDGRRVGDPDKSDAADAANKANDTDETAEQTADQSDVSVSNHTGPDHTGPDHTGPDHTGPDHTGPDHTGPDHTGPDHTGPDHTGPDHTGDDRRSGRADRTIDEPGSDTLVDPPTSGIVPLDEPSSEPALGGPESSSVSSYSEPNLAAPSSPPEPSARASGRRYTRSSAGESGPTEPGAPADMPRNDTSGETDTPGPTAKMNATDEMNSTDEINSTDEMTSTAQTNSTAQINSTAQAHARSEPTGPAHDQLEAVFTTCFRIRPGYKRVSGVEVACILGPPGVVLGALAILCGVYLAGLDAAFNPFMRWSWATAAAAVAAGWLLLGAAGRHWRTKWRGWRPVIMRRTDVRQEAELIADAQKLSVGQRSWRWSLLQDIRLRRWDSPLDDVCGWALIFEPADAQPIYLVAPEQDRDHWQNSPYQLDDIPYEGWQLDPHDFETIRRRVL